jgi:hypothetical protein
MLLGELLPLFFFFLVGYKCLFATFQVFNTARCCSPQGTCMQFTDERLHLLTGNQQHATCQ